MRGTVTSLSERGATEPSQGFCSVAFLYEATQRTVVSHSHTCAEVSFITVCTQQWERFVTAILLEVETLACTPASRGVFAPPSIPVEDVSAVVLISQARALARISQGLG